MTEVGPVEIEVPRDRDGSFEPQIVRKRQRRLDGVDGIVLSLSAKGLTTGEISAHLAEVYGASVSKDTISAITDRVLDAMAEWQSRPLDPVYPVVFVDAIRVKIRDGNVVNRPIYLAMGVTVDGERDILGLWAGEHGDGEGAKFWLRVLTEIKNRGVRDVLMLVCDGLKGLPDAVNTVWDKTIVQTCVVHLLRNSFRYASKRDWPELARDLKPIYTAPSAAGRTGPVRRVLRQVGEALPGDHSPVDRRVGGVRAVPRLRRRDPQDHLHHERDRVGQRPAPPRGPRPRALPHRAGRAQVPLHGADGPRPHRPRPRTLDHPLEGRTERLRRRVSFTSSWLACASRISLPNAPAKGQMGSQIAGAKAMGARRDGLTMT